MYEALQNKYENLSYENMDKKTGLFVQEKRKRFISVLCIIWSTNFRERILWRANVLLHVAIRGLALENIFHSLSTKRYK